MNIGFLSFVPIESFVDKDYKRSRSDKFSLWMTRFEPRGPIEEASNWSWMPVTAALKRDIMIVVEAKSPAHRAFIRFGEREDECRYDLTGIMPRFLEHGSIHTFTEIPAEEDDPRFQKIITCPFRFVVITSTPSPVRQKAWIIGLNELREVKE